MIISTTLQRLYGPLKLGYLLVKMFLSRVIGVPDSDCDATPAELATSFFFEDHLLDSDLLAQHYIKDPDAAYIPDDFLNVRIPNTGIADNNDLSDNLIQDTNALYMQFGEAYKKQKTALLPPSEYAQASNWPSQQRRNRRLLCGRPTRQRGIPLCTLHDVFRQFIIDMDTPLPSNTMATRATRSAHALCSFMGDSFEDDEQCSEEFDGCIGNVFGNWRRGHSISLESESCSAVLGRTLMFMDESILLFREDKKDIGTGDEVYIQVARDYDMYCKSFTGYHKDIGAPAFLLCVTGPLLLISGAFFDGENTVVEPLTSPFHMLEDSTQRRQRALAKVLYALWQAMDSLESSLVPQHQAQIFAPSTPRLYLDCVSVESNTPIGTLSNFEATEYLPRLLFTANLNRPNADPERVLVKLLPRPYGHKVQTCLEGAPTAYVMEYLDVSWTGLHLLATKNRSALVGTADLLTAIKASIDRILILLQGVKMVHGDFRPNNLMIKLGDDGKLPVVVEGFVQLKVVDFDWAGEAGKATYSPQRNEEIPGLEWPGLPGDAIGAHDDAQVVGSWWRGFPP
ncbi:hypothetical protein ONZ45_g10915 [Pleurotus djamor]|nr:hypothetical protein ONZ45_g10915 [Pleurotus djamor]